jgi:hypothetical protein
MASPVVPENRYAGDVHGAVVQAGYIGGGLHQLKPEQLEELVDHLDEMTVEVDQPDARVHVLCE